MEEQNYHKIMEQATAANEAEKVAQFNNMAQETMSALAATVPKKSTNQDDTIYELASKMILEGAPSSMTLSDKTNVEYGAEDTSLVANKDKILMEKPSAHDETKPKQYAPFIQDKLAIQTKASETHADDFDDIKDSRLSQLTSIADQANFADEFANSGNSMDDDEDDEDEAPVDDKKVQTKSVTDADNYKVFKYRLEHEPQNVANKIWKWL